MSRQRVDAPTTIRNAYGQFAIIPSSLVRATELSDGALRLYALLWDYSSSTDREAWPTRTTMAGDLGVSVDTIDRRVNELAKFGAISVEVDLQSDARRNVYTILQLDQTRVIPKGRKSAAHSDEAIGRTDAAQIGRKFAVAYKEEPEPSNQKTTVRSPKHPNDGAVDNSGTGPQPPLATPKTVSHTFGKPLVPADVFAAVGQWMPVTFDDEQMTQLANEIIAESGARAVDDRTAYVIRAIRNTVRDDERRRGRWLLRADEIALETIAIRERAGVRF